MAKITRVTLVCDGCGTEEHVATRTLVALEGEARAECWDRVVEIVGDWRPVRGEGSARRRRRTA